MRTAKWNSCDISLRWMCLLFIVRFRCARAIRTALFVECIIAINDSVTKLVWWQTAFRMTEIFTFLALCRTMLLIEKVATLIYSWKFHFKRLSLLELLKSVYNDNTIYAYHRKLSQIECKVHCCIEIPGIRCNSPFHHFCHDNRHFRRTGSCAECIVSSLCIGIYRVDMWQQRNALEAHHCRLYNEQDHRTQYAIANIDFRHTQNRLRLFLKIYKIDKSIGRSNWWMRAGLPWNVQFVLALHGPPSA